MEILCTCQFLSNTLLLPVSHTKSLEVVVGVPTDLRFFAQRCILRNTVYLPDFNLHRVLSITSVEIVCCHIALLHRLRGYLTYGSFQLHILRLKL